MSPLKNILEKLSQGSVDAVQNGNELTDFNKYMHVTRPIEQELVEAMYEIDKKGGGIVLIAGSAGDGKSHLISTVREGEKKLASHFDFHTDATESFSPTKSALQTLEEKLKPFDDNSIEQTGSKLLIAINMGIIGKLIDNETLKSTHSIFIQSIKKLLTEEQPSTDEKEDESTNRIKIVDLSHIQIFEYKDLGNKEYCLNSKFMSEILEKITSKSDKNPFYKAYLETIASKDPNFTDPLIVNFKLLSNSNVQKSIIDLVIESIIRFKLIVSPREFLDFIYSILVNKSSKSGSLKNNYCSYLLPTLLFTSKNRISKSISNLDPIKRRGLESDDKIMKLYSSYQIPDFYFTPELSDIKTLINKYFDEDEKTANQVIYFLIRNEELRSYKSHSVEYLKYINFLELLKKNDRHTAHKLNHLILDTASRHYGEYIDKKYLPIDIFGNEYYLFTEVELRLKQTYNSPDKNPNRFNLYAETVWESGKDIIHLTVDYKLYEYLTQLKKGLYPSEWKRRENSVYSTFIEQATKSGKESNKLIVMNGQNKRSDLIYYNEEITLR